MIPPAILWIDAGDPAAGDVETVAMVISNKRSSVSFARVELKISRGPAQSRDHAFVG